MYGRQLSSLQMVSQKQEAVSERVPRFPQRDALVADMRANMPEDAVCLVHGDYKWDNLLLHPSEPRVVAVLDWELSTIGHPCSDLANLCGAIYFGAYNPDAVGGGGVQGMPDFEASGVPAQEELVQYYCQLVQRPFPDPDMCFYFGFYFWRGAIIAQGIGARLAMGQASSAVAKDFAAMTGPLGELARMQIDDLLAQQSAPRPSPLLLGDAAQQQVLRLDDDFTHKAQGRGEAGNFSESVYVNFADPRGAFGGMCRVANRPDENSAEVTFCVFLRDGSCLFSFQRPKITSNNGWAAGGARVDVLRPMEKLRVRFQGKGYRLVEPWLLRDPDTMFRAHRSKYEDMELEADLLCEAVGPAFVR
jgi:hypothetical protein